MFRLRARRADLYRKGDPLVHYPDQHRYSFHGITLASEVPLPTLNPSVAPANDAVITLRRGDPPTVLEKAAATAITYQVTPSQYLLTLPKIVRYLISDGESIVYGHTDGDAESATFFGLNWAFPALLLQRGITTLQASAIETAEGAVIICGAPGSGKSTLVAKLNQMGYRLLADEFVTLQIDAAGQPFTYPGSPNIHLWRKSLNQLGYTDRILQPVRPGIQKFALPISEDTFCDQALPLARIYVLASMRGDKAMLTPVSPEKALVMLLHHLTHRRMALDTRQMQVHWQLIARTIQRVPVTLLSYASFGYEADQLAQVIEPDWKPT